MTIESDIRFLAELDPRHAQLRRVSDRWLNALGRAILMQHDTDGVPLVGCVLRSAVCPIDPTAELQIEFWIANLDRRRKLRRAFVRSSLATVREMRTRGAARVWGFVPKKADHLVTFLDRVVAAGRCERWDGDEIKALITADDIIPAFENHAFYISPLDDAETFMRGAR